MRYEDLARIRNIYMVGIGGVGMTGLALLLTEKGFTVRGSDERLGSRTVLLERAGIKVYAGHNAMHIDGADLVCYSSAIKEDNPERKRAQASGIPLMTRGELLAVLTHASRTIAVSGSHGKTTTSALIAFLLTETGCNPGVFIGGAALNYERYAWVGNDLFVIETDESDGSFLYYEPWISIITNIDREHLDFYSGIDEIRKSFTQFAACTKNICIGCGDDENVRLVLTDRKALTYGFGQHNRVRAENVRVEEGTTVFDLLFDAKKFSEVRSPLFGRHNVLNALSAMALCWHLGMDIKRIISLLERFKGVKRRFQLKTQIGAVQFFDDYAHHPREIKATLEAVRAFSQKRIVAIFQPHRYSRVQHLLQEFASCFGLCDVLIITDIYSAGEENKAGITSRDIVDIMAPYKNEVYYIPKDKLIQKTPEFIKENDCVIGLGAGDINLLMDKITQHYSVVHKGKITVS